MRRTRSVFLVMGSALLLSLSACVDDSDGKREGVYRGRYEVPIVSADLAGAAVYDVPEVEWKVVNGAAELSYDLPLGLVGEKLSVKFSGDLGASGAASALSGAPGTASCTVAAASISCNETMTGLLPITPDYAVIEQTAAAEYPGPAAHRIDVAKAFAVDPIGVLIVDLNAPTTTDVEIEEPES